MLSIKVFDEDALTNKFVVDSDGTITFPLIGRVDVAGKTTREIEEHLTKLLQPDYVRTARRSLSRLRPIAAARFTCWARCARPGRYNIEGPMTLLEVIANAGSTTPAASNTIIVQRYKDGACGRGVGAGWRPAIRDGRKSRASTSTNCAKASCRPTCCCRTAT